MAIRIITDSTCDIELEEQERLGIDIVPLTVSFGEDQYLDRVEINKKDFFDKLRKCDSLPTTSQANPDGFLKLFSQYTNAGDVVVYIGISSKLSGTYQSALIAKDMAGSKDIYVIDSKNATFGLALLVRAAVKMRDEGKNADEIVSSIEDLIGRIKLMAVVSTLRYLKMGGRISASVAAVGNILGIVPVLGLDDGEIKAFGKVRGKKAAYKWILDRVIENGVDRNYPIELAHAGAPELIDELISAMPDELELNFRNSGRNEIGCVIGTHTGPGCVGISYVVPRK